MAQETRCSTPGAIFSTRIFREGVILDIKLPFDLDLSAADAIYLERTLHNAVELALAPLFAVKQMKTQILNDPI